MQREKKLPLKKRKTTDEQIEIQSQKKQHNQMMQRFESVSVLYLKWWMYVAFAYAAVACVDLLVL